QFVYLELGEMGDNQNDGVFNLKVNKLDLSITGTWKAYLSDLTRKFTLERKHSFVGDFDFDSKVTEENFLEYFSFASDSLGEYSLTSDGLITYEFFSSVAENQEGIAAPKVATGSWVYKGGKLTVFWQPNSAFPHLKSVFAVEDLRSKDGYLMLKGEKRTLYSGYEMMY